jgi:hypothetical protein
MERALCSSLHSGRCLAQCCSMLPARSVAEPHGILALLLESGGGPCYVDSKVNQYWNLVILYALRGFLPACPNVALSFHSVLLAYQRGCCIQMCLWLIK